MTAKEFKEQFDLKEYIYNNVIHSISGDRIFIHCPFHNDKSPSFLINQNGGFCFSCGKGWDSIDVLMKLCDKTFHEVINMEFDNNIVQMEHTPIKKKEKQPLTAALVENYHKRLMRNSNKLVYLNNRGVTKSVVEKAKIGYGIPLDVYGRTFQHPRYVIPHYDFNGNLYSAKYRIDPEFETNEPQKYITHPGAKTGLYNIASMRQNDVVYVGSQFDAALLWFGNSIASVCPPSESIFKDEWIPFFIGKNVLIWLDNDETGRNGSLLVYSKIKSVVKHASIFVWTNEFAPKDDFTDFYKKYGIDAVKKQICESLQKF